MKAADLAARQPIGRSTLPAELTVYRVQLAVPRSTSTVVGPVVMAPPGIMACRFDLPAMAVGYFTLGEETALYETWARRDAASIPLTEIARRKLLTATFAAAKLTIADLRIHAGDWPALQSMRYASTQELAHDLAVSGYDGIVYHSAQQFASPCLALFGAAVGAVSWVRDEPLFDAASGRLHVCVVDAARGAELPVVP